MTTQTIKLIVSDLHVADGDRGLDGYGERQQAALEGLLTAAGRSSGDPLGEAEDIELIINGDCFDFLAVEPYDTGGVMNIELAVEKLRKMIAAHGPFFEILGRFLSQQGRRITFMTGNHDIELCFAEVRTGIVEVMGMQQNDSRVYFCPASWYRPLPDVYIEHGNAYDFWSADLSGFWDESGHVRTANPQVMTLPFGSHYEQHVGLPILVRYPYLDRFEPPMNITRQVALFCLLNPAAVVQVVQHALELLDRVEQGQPHKALIHLAPGDEHHPDKLFEQAMMDLITFQQGVSARSPGWKDPRGEEVALTAQMQAMMEFAMLRETLSRVDENEGMMEAMEMIFAPTMQTPWESLTVGMQNVLKNDPSLRYAIAGHSHMEGVDATESGSQIYVNAGSWRTRYALPEPGEVTPELIAWLRQPSMREVPLRDVTRMVFALVSASEGAASSASLYTWKGGVQGTYHAL